MKRFLKSCEFMDKFKYKFYFRIGNTIQNSTLFSIFISILVISPLIAYFVLIANNTWQRTSPKINVQEYDVNKRPYMNLTKDNFRFAFRIILQNGSVFSGNITDYFQFDINYRFMAQNLSAFYQLDSQSFVMEKCKKENFMDFENYYDLNLRDAFCLSYDSMNIGGYWDEEKAACLQITLGYCNSRSNINCKSKMEIIDELQGGYIYVYIESQDVDATNYKTPLKKSMKTYFQSLDLQRKKDWYFYMQQVELFTYDNLIYNYNANQQFFNKQFSMVSDSLTANDESHVVDMFIFSSNKIQIIERTYMTLLEAAAVVGGISSFVLVMGTFITFKYNDMRLQTKLINKLFSFDLNNSKKITETMKEIKLFKTEHDITEKNSAISRVLKKGSLKFKNTDTEPNINIANEILNIDSKNLNFFLTENKLKDFIDTPRSSARNDHNLESENSPIKFEMGLSSLSKIQNREDSSKKNLSKSEEKYLKTIEYEKNNDFELNQQIKENKKFTKIKFSTWEIINCIVFPFCKSRKTRMKYDLYMKSSNYLLKYINIFNFIKRLEDIEKMKSILLNNHQLALFNYLSKPTVSLMNDESNDDDKNYMSHLDKLLLLTNNMNKNDENITQVIQNYYNELIDKGNQTLIDIRLFDYLDEDFKRKLKFNK